MEPSQTTEASQISFTVSNLGGTEILRATLLPSDCVWDLKDKLTALGEFGFKLSYNGEVVTNHESTLQELGVSTDDIMHLIRLPYVRVIASPSTENWHTPEFRDKVAPGFDVVVAIEDSTTMEELRKSVCKRLGVRSDWVYHNGDLGFFGCGSYEERLVLDCTGCLTGTPRQLVVDINHASSPTDRRRVESTNSFPLSDFGVKGGKTLHLVAKPLKRKGEYDDP